MLIGRSGPLSALARVGGAVERVVVVRGTPYRSSRITTFCAPGTQPNAFLGSGDYRPPDFHIAQIRDVFIPCVAKSVLARGHGLIDEFNIAGARAYLDTEMAKEFAVTDQGWALRGPVQVVDGLTVPMSHFGIATFGHLVLDGLLQLFLFRHAIGRGEAKLAFWPFAAPWGRAVLDACGLTDRHLIMLDGPVVHFRAALLSSALAAAGVYFPNTLGIDFFAWLRSLFVTDALPRRRLYAARNPSDPRGLRDEAALVQLCRRYGLEAVTPGQMPFADQVRLFASADVVVSPWGSSLTLAPLMCGRRTVVEILPDTTTDPWFLRQAIVHGLDYRPVIARSRPDGTIEPDLAVVEAALQSLHP